MSQQGGRPTGPGDDWWEQLYEDDCAEDTGPTAAGDSLDDRYASAAGTLDVPPRAAHTGEAAPEDAAPPASRPAGAPGTYSSTDRGPSGPDAPGDAPSGPGPDWWQRAPGEVRRAAPPVPAAFPDAPQQPEAVGRDSGRPDVGRPPAEPPRPADRASRRPGETRPPAGSSGPTDRAPGSPTVSGTGAHTPSGPTDRAPGSPTVSGTGAHTPSDPAAPTPPAAAPPPPSTRSSGVPQPPAAPPPPPGVPPSPAGAASPPSDPRTPSAPAPSSQAAPAQPSTPPQPPAPAQPPAPPLPSAPPPPPVPPRPGAGPGASADDRGASAPPSPPPPRPDVPPATAADEAVPAPGRSREDASPAAVPSRPEAPSISHPASPDAPSAPVEQAHPADFVLPADYATPVDYVGTRPPTYDAEPTALPLADPDALDDLVPDTVLDGARYGACTVRAVSVRGDSARYRGEPRRDALLTARFGAGEQALVLVAMATGARATPGAHRAATEACQWIAQAVGRSHGRLAEDIRAARRGDLKSGLHRLTDRSLGRLRAGAVEQGIDPEEYTATLRCLLLPADPHCRTRVFFGVGAGGLFRLRDGEWQDIEPRVSETAGDAVAGFGARPAETPDGDRLTMDFGVSTPPSPYEPDPQPPRDPFRFRASVARPGDTFLMCTGGLAEPLRGEPELSAYLKRRWSGPHPPGLASFLADAQVRVKGYADDRTAAAVWEA
ncbi:protein phosphatase 2C domain-containing protein [Streptomyces sp. NPDC086766]|uniref:protein phosphatase 2C domain-containing protein n=1 Tax=Streptomyces sp. NPDC086766 TaxID=3365754 RepID=UPI003814675D